MDANKHECCSVRCPQRIRTLRWGLATASKLWTLQRNHGLHARLQRCLPEAAASLALRAGLRAGINTNVVACAVLSAFGLSAGDSPRRASCGLYSVTTGETHLGNGCSGARRGERLYNN